MKTKLEQLVYELELSLKVIQKWHGVVFEKKQDFADNDCAFCIEDQRQEDCGNLCCSCPIVKYKLGLVLCENTPYIAWDEHFYDVPRIADTPEKQHLAVKELLFLVKVANHICGLIEKEIAK